MYNFEFSAHTRHNESVRKAERLGRQMMGELQDAVDEAFREKERIIENLEREQLLDQEIEGPGDDGDFGFDLGDPTSTT